PSVAALRDNRVDERRQCGVRRRHFSEIWFVIKSRSERIGRRIRKVRFENVDPAEVRSSAAINPALRTCDGLRSAAFLFQERRSDLRIDEAVVVQVEPTAQAESRGERKRADKGTGAIATRFEHGCERLNR